MSCYEWENGTIKLPTKIYAKFRREYINEYNAIQLRAMDKLNAWRELVLNAGSGKRGYDFEEAMKYYANSHGEYIMVESLFPDDRKKPLKPTRKMFNFVNGKNNSFDVDTGGAGIGFDAKSHSVSWSVFENNHAVEDARATEEAYVFFKMLGRVTFTRGSGGVIVGNNEYNSDDYCEGGGGNYVVSRYGK